MTLDVLLPLKFDHPFTYNVPKDISVKVGDFVLVPFQNKDIVGIVWGKSGPIKASIKIKDIKKLVLFCALGWRSALATKSLVDMGFNNVAHVDGGFDAWKNSGKEVDALSQVTAEELKGIEGATVVDVRKSGEYLSEHLIDAIHVELDYINDQMASVPQEETFYVHCAGGYRSVIASSILKARGYHNMVDVAGGFKAMKEAGLNVSDYVCPTTL